MNIRDLVPEDEAAVVEIFNLHNEQEGWDEPIEKFRHELNLMFAPSTFNRPCFLVYEDDGKNIVGFAGYSNTGFDDGVFGLFWAVVHPEHQYKGIGKALTQERLKRIKDLNGNIIFSTTRKTWHLERFGFTCIAPRGDGYFLMMLKIE